MRPVSHLFSSELDFVIRVVNSFLNWGICPVWVNSGEGRDRWREASTDIYEYNYLKDMKKILVHRGVGGLVLLVRGVDWRCAEALHNHFLVAVNFCPVERCVGTWSVALR